MHQEARITFRDFVDKYLSEARNISIADVGSFDVNGTYKEQLRQDWDYFGIDIVPGKNVNFVVPVRGKWSIRSEEFDVVISGQMLEHCWKPWETVKEMARILKPGGLMFLSAPNSWPYHEHPTDNWRFWPEGFKALFDEAGLTVLETYFRNSETIGIARK